MSKTLVYLPAGGEVEVKKWDAELSVGWQFGVAFGYDEDSERRRFGLLVGPFFLGLTRLAGE